MAGMQTRSVEAPRRARVARRPKHTWHVRVPPFCLQIVTMAPVLPGETLDNAVMQARVVTDPIINPIIGWWHEYYLFYVPVSAMAEASEIRGMFISPETSLGVSTTNNLSHYIGDDTTGGNQYDWYDQCHDSILNNWFRDEQSGTIGLPTQDADSTFTLSGSGWDKVRVEGPGWLDSAVPTATMAEGSLDVLIAENMDTTAGADLYASEIETAMRQYQLLREAGLTNQTYEEYLMTFGVDIPTLENVPIPELLRYSKAWQYPSNTIDPSNGTPRSAVSWAVTERVDKKRFFKEPGFLCWCTCTRPKVYFNKQTSFAASAMFTVYPWLPATLYDDRRVGFINIGTDTILKDVSGGVWFDAKDLFVHGDQFVNFLMTDTASNMVSLPETASGQGLNREFVSDTDIKALFVTGASAYFVREDGVCDFNIAGTVRDTTPTLVGL